MRRDPRSGRLARIRLGSLSLSLMLFAPTVSSVLTGQPATRRTKPDLGRNGIALDCLCVCVRDS